MKHVVMLSPQSSGLMFFNYKKRHSIVLMAICNAKYEFTLVDIGESGRNSDGGVFSNGHIGLNIEDCISLILNLYPVHEKAIHVFWLVMKPSNFNRIL